MPLLEICLQVASGRKASPSRLEGRVCYAVCDNCWWAAFMWFDIHNLYLAQTPAMWPSTWGVCGKLQPQNLRYEHAALGYSVCWGSLDAVFGDHSWYHCRPICMWSSLRSNYFFGVGKISVGGCVGAIRGCKGLRALRVARKCQTTFCPDHEVKVIWAGFFLHSCVAPLACFIACMSCLYALSCLLSCGSVISLSMVFVVLRAFSTNRASSLADSTNKSSHLEVLF